MKLTSINLATAARDLIEHVNDPRVIYDYGFPRLTNALCTGPGHVVVIAAKTSVGKSAFAMQVATHMAAAGLVTAYISLEMSPESLARRFLARSVGMACMRNGDATDAQIAQMQIQARTAASLPIQLINGAGCSARDVGEYIQHTDTRVVVIDYLQLMTGGTGSNATERLADIVKSLSTIARSTGVAIIILAQNLIKGEQARSGEPTMADAQGTSQLAQDADAYLILYREDEADKNSRRVIKIDKVRDGDPGVKMYLDFNGLYMTFTESRDQSRHEPEKHQFKTFGKSKQDKPQLVPLPDYEQDELPL